MLLAFAFSLLVLCGLIAWLQNVHIITANGMYKSIQAEPWIADPSRARLDPSNYLYFPLYGALCRLLDWLGIDRGVPWRQFAWLNAFFASLATVIVYAFVHRLTGSVRAAALAAAFHLGCGFVLLLAVINEDIMPGYTLVLIAMLLAGLWFDQPTWRRVAVVGVVFTVGWLIEWRLIFPTLPAFVLVLAVAPQPWRERLKMIGVLLITIVATAGIVQQAWEGHNGAVGLHDLLWTGKGVDSGWGGFGWGKAWMMLAGVGDYFLTTGVHTHPVDAQEDWPSLAVSVVLQLAILLFSLVVLWPRRSDPQLRAIAVVFLCTLGAGQILNFYSQPHDPQMQVNVMVWLSIAFALLAMAATRRFFIVLAVLASVPLVHNVATFARWRGGDAEAIAALKTIEQRFEPAKTVFVYWGFEQIAMWHYALWSRTWDWDGKPNDARFKWIAITAGAIRHAGWTPEQHAEAIRRDLDWAFAKGYRVVISDVWTWNVATLAGKLAGLGAANRAAAIYAVLHDNFDATPVLEVPGVGPYYELLPRNR